MSNAAIIPSAAPAQAASSNASMNAAGNSADAPAEDKDFASVLDDTVTTAAQGIGAQTALPTATLSSLAANVSVDADTGKDGATFDLAVLLPMIAAHFATAGGVAAIKTADGTNYGDAVSQPPSVPSLNIGETGRTIEGADLAAPPLAEAAGRTAILADKGGAPLESSTAKQGGEVQTALVPGDRAAVEVTTALAPADRAASNASPALRIETPVAAPRWGDELAQKVMWIANRNDGHAELVLTPPHLGRLEVSVAVKHDGETSLMFVSSNQQVRDTIEQSLPRLREILADAGIALGHADVQSDSAPRDGAQFQGRAARDDAAPVGGAVPSSVTAASQRHGVGLIDTFA